MVEFNGGAGTVDGAGIVYEWSNVIVVIENDVIVEYFTQFDGDARPSAATDVTIGAFNVQLTSLTYQNIGGAVGVNNLTLNAAATFTQSATNFVVSGALINNGLMNIYANTTITGAIENNLLITIGAGDSNERFVRLDDVAGGFSIGGTGDIRLRDGFLTGQGGASSVTALSIASKISGFGSIGSDFNHLSFPSDGGHLAITNTASGTIEADVADKVLNISPELSASDPMTNFGLLAASNGGILSINNTSVDQFGSGLIWAGNGSRVELNGSIISGGRLGGEESGVILSVANTTRLSNIEIMATAHVNAGRTLTLEGFIVNSGEIIADNFLSRVLIDADDVFLTGNGALTMVGNYGGSAIQAEGAGATLNNGMNHTIKGFGTIFGDGLSLVNEGLISAQPDNYSPDDTESIGISGLAQLRNAGVIEATAGTRVSLSFMEGVDNHGGIVRANGDGSVVALSQISIEGGTFATTGTGVIVADGFNVRLSAFQTLEGTNFDATSMQLSGPVVNRGAMSVTGFLTLDGTLNLSGGGSLKINDNFNGSHVVGRVAGTVLNNVDNTITGDGAIGVGVGLFNQEGNLSVINSGVIAADADPYNASSGLALATLAALTNTGLLEARNGATLSIQNPASGVIENAGGTIRATGAGSVVSLSGSVVSGGTLDATNGGRFTMTNMTLDGSAGALTTNADFTVAGGRLTLKGAVANAGDVVISESGSLFFSDDTTLSGGGTFNITPPYHFSIISLSGAVGATLTNLGNTFGGIGSFGAGSGMVLVNGVGGVVTANQAGGTLTVETGSVVTNQGVLRADGGILNIIDNVTGSGRIEVKNGGTAIVDQGTDQRVNFVGGSADTLSLSRRDPDTGGFDFPISGMGVGDRIRLDVIAGVGSEADFSFQPLNKAGVLTTSAFTDGLGVAYGIRLGGTYSYGQFQLIGGADGFLGFVRVASHDGSVRNNILTAAVGGERVIGLDGKDILISGAGDDLLDGSRGSDTADFRLATSGVTASLATQAAQAIGGGLGTDRLISIENLNGSGFNDTLTGNATANQLSGGAGGDVLNGGGGADTLTGGVGNDRLDGGTGNDVMLGGSGNDTYVVDSLNDRVFETTKTSSAINAGGIDTVESSVSFNLSTRVAVRFVENLTLTGNDAINAVGNALANELTGNAASNSLTGGAGRDLFVFNAPLGAGNVDHITDFKPVDDTIRLDDAIFTGLSRGVLLKDAFIANATGEAKDAEDRIIYDTSTGKLYFDADGTDPTDRILFATLDAHLALSRSDFVVF